jgi:hypothetical protein
MRQRFLEEAAAALSLEVLAVNWLARTARVRMRAEQVASLRSIQGISKIDLAGPVYPE